MSDQQDGAETKLPEREYALVEIFGHRRHYAEVCDVERAGTKLLRVHDVDTDEVHFYGGAAIFSMTIISKARLEAHVAQVQERKRADEEREARWKAEDEARRSARILAAALPAADLSPEADFDGEDGVWERHGDNFRLKLLPAYYDHSDRVHGALMLVSEVTADIEEVSAWTSEQRRDAAEWALAMLFAASDNEGIVIPTRPHFLTLQF